MDFWIDVYLWSICAITGGLVLYKIIRWMVEKKADRQSDREWIERQEREWNAITSSYSQKYRNKTKAAIAQMCGMPDNVHLYFDDIPLDESGQVCSPRKSDLGWYSQYRETIRILISHGIPVH